MGLSEAGETAATLPEAADLGFRPAKMSCPSPVAVIVAGEVEALASDVAGLKLDGASGGDGAGEGFWPEAEVEEVMVVGATSVHVFGEGAVSEVKGPEESEVERAWRGEEEWREGNEGTEGVGNEGEDGVQQEKGEEGKGAKFSYPQRPGEPDCAFYIRTGYCAFGANCKFNHPQRGKRILVVKSSEIDKYPVKEKQDEHSSNAGKIQCKYYQTPGGCKYGSNCRYLHEKETSEAGLELNFLGLPMRPGEKECPFYMRNGSCKFGSNCRFHHPNPTGMGEPVPVSGYLDNGSSRQRVTGISQQPNAAWSSQSCPNQPVSFIDTSPSCVPGVLLPHQVHQNSEWNEYQAPTNSLYPLEGNKKYPTVQSMYKPTTNVNGHSGHFQVQTEEYPERPGQPECQFYMENGSCKYKSACRFHHPKDRLARLPVCLSPMGLPLRPDQPVCTYYSRYGICKFGPTCRYDHPMDRGSSKAHLQTTTIIP